MDAIDFNDLLSDIKREQKRAEGAKALATQHELAKFVWPMMQAIVESCHERFTALEEEMDAVLDEEGNILQPDFAGQIVGCLTLGLQLCDAVEKSGTNDLTLQLVKQFREGATLTIEAVAASSEGIDDDEEGDEEEDEGDGGDEGESDESGGASENA